MDGEVKSIEIRGIERAGADNVCQDGSLNEAVGVVYKDGSLIPYRATEADANLPQGTRLIYLHKTYQQDNVLVYYENDNQEMVLAWATKEAVDNGTVRWDSDIIDTMPQGVELLECAFVGNMLVERRTDNIYYFVFNKDEQRYESRTIDLQDLPQVDIKVDRGLWNDDIYEGYKSNQDLHFGNDEVPKGFSSYIGMGKYMSTFSGGVRRGKDDTDSTEGDSANLQDASETTTKKLFEEYNKTACSQLEVGIGLAEDRGGLTGYNIAWAVWRLKNGEYVTCEMPILLCPPNHYNAKNFVKITYDNADLEKAVDTASIHYSVPQGGGGAVLNLLPQTAYQMLEFNIKDKNYSDMMQYTGNKEVYLDEMSVADINLDDFKKSNKAYSRSVLFDGEHEEHTHQSYGEAISNMVPKEEDVVCPLYTTRYVYHCYENDERNFLIDIDVTYALTNKLSFRMTALPEGLKDMVSSLCIFLSPDISPYQKFDKEENIYSDGMQWFSWYHNRQDHNDRSNVQKAIATAFPRYRKPSSIIEDIKKVESLYKVKEVFVEDLPEAGKWITVDLQGKLGSNIYTLESIGAHSVRQIKSSNGGLFTFNSRLHLFNYFNDDKIEMRIQPWATGIGQRKYGEGINPTSVSQGFTVLYSHFDVEIKKPNGGTKHRIVEYNLNKGGTKAEDFFLPSIFFYPSTDAVSVTYAVLTVINGKRETAHYKATMHKMEKFGMSYAVIESKTRNGYDDDFVPSHFYIADTINNGEYVVPKDTTGIEENVGFIKVAETNLPNYFKPINDYKVGDGRIIALAQMSIALTQDTFGAYPLLVFCTDGIYSLGIDQTGTIAYSSVAPFSREVCTNKNTICEIDGAVIFATDKGLMMATGQKVDAFNPMLNGTPKHIPQKDKSLGTGLYVYGNAVKHPRLVPLEKDLDKMQVIETKDFIDYLQDADTYVKYASAKTALVVFNKSKNFIYFIDIATRFATKLNICLDKCNNNYPSADFFNTSKDKRYNFEYDTAEGTTQCLLQTRPIKLVLANKASYRVLLNGYFHSTKEDAMAGLYVLGSLDADHWQLIGAKEKPLQGGFHDLGCLTERVSMKYIMIIAVGVLGCDSHIDSIEISTNTKYQNKLR